MLQELWNQLNPDGETLLKRNICRAAHARPEMNGQQGAARLHWWWETWMNSLPVYNQDAHPKFLADGVQMQADEA